MIGGDPERWRRRLDGFAAELRIRLEESRRADPESSLSQALERDAARLAHLASFALPLIRDMAAWPARATWGEWLERFEQLAPRVLRDPGARAARARGPAADGGRGPGGPARGPGRPVRAAAAGRGRPAGAALRPRVRRQPGSRRSGRIVPRRVRPRAWPSVCSRRKHVRIRCCPIGSARSLTNELETSSERSAQASGCCCISLSAPRPSGCICSYPRLDVAESRVRVPSFYALDAMRGVTGRIPDHEELAAAAVRAGNATLAWPAPPDAADGDRRPGARPCRPARPARRRTRRQRARPRAVPAAPQRGAAADGDRAVGAYRRRSGRSTTAWCTSPIAPVRRWRPSGSAAGPTRSRRCSASPRARTSSC